MRVASGNIPKEITYVAAGEQTIRITWEDAEQEDEQSSNDGVITETVRPTFVSDAANEKTLATARNWAKNASKVYNYQKKIWEVRPVGKEITKKNEPSDGYRIFNLDVRAQGGRAWKCGDNEGHYFDLREDVLLDLLRTEGVSPGGYLNGKYIWAKVNSTMKLVRVNSELHKALIKTTNRREMKNLKKSELKPWTIYQEKNSNTFLHVGKYNFFDISVDQVNKVKENEKQTVLWENVLREREQNKAKPNSNLTGWSFNQDYYQSQYARAYGNQPPPPVKKVEFAVKSLSHTLWIPLSFYGSKWSDSASESTNKRFVENILKKFSEKLLVTEHNEFSVIKYGTFKDLGPKVVMEGFPVNPVNISENIRDLALHNYLQEVNQLMNIKNQTLITKERERLKIAARWIQFGTISLEGEELPENILDFWMTEIISKEPK